MEDWEKKQLAEQEAAEKLAIENAWKEMAREILSTTRVDPKTKGKSPELFIRYTAEITDEHVKALKRSKYGTAFRHFIQLWEARANKPKYGSIDEGVELFRTLSTTTHSPYREIQHLQKGVPTLSDEEILQKVPFLTTYYWDSNHSNFDVNDLAEQLNIYLASGMEWDHIERCVLKMCVRRAYDTEAASNRKPNEVLSEKWFGKDSVVGLVVGMLLRLISFLIPRLVAFAVTIAVLIWCLDNLDASRHPVLAIVGLLWVTVSLFSTLMHYGTHEIRHGIRRLIRRPYLAWNEFDPFIDADLHALNSTVANFRAPHANLRLVREQLVRLQSTPVQFPVQLLTCIDRALAKDIHFW